jgi:hypothetical protein
MWSSHCVSALPAPVVLLKDHLHASPGRVLPLAQRVRLPGGSFSLSFCNSLLLPAAMVLSSEGKLLGDAET